MKTTKLTPIDEWALKSKNYGVTYGRLQQEETLAKLEKNKAKEKEEK